MAQVKGPLGLYWLVPQIPIGLQNAILHDITPMKIFDVQGEFKNRKGIETCVMR